MSLVAQIREKLATLPVEQCQCLSLMSFAIMVRSTDANGIDAAVQALVREGALKRGAFYYDEETDEELELTNDEIQDVFEQGCFTHPETGLVINDPTISLFYYKENKL